MPIDPILEGNTPELTDAEREALFGLMPAGMQADLANLFWQCEEPKDREIIYAELRQWYRQAARKGTVDIYAN